MKTKYCGLGARTWFATIAVVVTVTIVAALGALAVAASATSHHASNDNAVSGAAWFAEPAPPLSGNAMAGPANAAKMTAKDATKYAKGMSKVFHEAASKVLPCVVMITNSPATNVFQWTDTNATAAAAQFYRIKVGPPLP